jgi:hypothetical protein
MQCLQALRGYINQVFKINRNSGALKMTPYNKEAVEKAIKKSKETISTKEAKIIHALLKGHQSTEGK